MRIALYYRHIAPTDRPTFDALTSMLAQRHIDAVEVREGGSVDGCSVVFSIGGDGTLLSSVQCLRSSGQASFPPILGINFGHLGFLTTAGKSQLDTLVDDFLAGRYTIEERSLLQVSDANGCIGTRQASAGGTGPFLFPGSNFTYALNEAFLHRSDSASLLRTQVFVDGDYVATYEGDGVIVATPTGSTAYSLSCGGPILTPNSSCFVITPISAHTLTLRPIIVPDTSLIRLQGEAACITLGADSRRVAIENQALLNMQKAPFAIRLIRMNTQNFFSAIRDKLMWGSEVRM